MKIVLDTNIIVAAFATRGLCQDVFEFCLQEEEIVLSKHILKEVDQVLSLKLKIPPEKISSIIQFLEENAQMVESVSISESICRDLNDQAIIETAVTGHADILVSGDKDLLVLKKYKNIKILSPRGYWDSLMNRKKERKLR